MTGSLEVTLTPEGRKTLTERQSSDMLESGRSYKVQYSIYKEWGIMLESTSRLTTGGCRQAGPYAEALMTVEALRTTGAGGAYLNGPTGG